MPDPYVLALPICSSVSVLFVAFSRRSASKIYGKDKTILIPAKIKGIWVFAVQIFAVYEIFVTICTNRSCQNGPISI